MEYKDTAKLVYRQLVTCMIRDLVTFPYNLSLTRVASCLHLTIGQMSRVYHGVCSLTPDKFLVLASFYRTCTGKYPVDEFISSCKNVSNLPGYGVD